MSTVLSYKNGVIASKQYRCDLCGERIEAGEKYDRRSGVDGHDMWTTRMHPECHAFEESGVVDEEWYEDISDPAFERKSALEYAAREEVQP